MIKISILTSHYGSTVDLKKCINSVQKEISRNQSFSVEQLVFIDGLEGKNLNILQNIDKWKDKLVNTMFMVSSVNVGKSAALNHLLEKVDSDIVMFLDSDDLFLPGKIYNQCQFLNRCANTAIGSHYYIYNAKDYTFNPISQPTSESLIRSLFVFYPGILFSSLALKLTDIYKYNLFFAERIRGGIDYDFYFKIMQNMSITNLNSYLVAYKKSSDGITQSLSSRAEQIQVHVNTVRQILSHDSNLINLQNEDILKAIFMPNQLGMKLIDCLVSSCFLSWDTLKESSQEKNDTIQNVFLSNNLLLSEYFELKYSYQSKILCNLRSWDNSLR